MRVRPYVDADCDSWDDVVLQSGSATFLHSRRFLSYHGPRFIDRSLVCEDERGNILAIFPAALAPKEETRVVSHPGATYGGLIWSGRLGADDVDEMIGAILDHLRRSGATCLDYKSVPYHLQRFVSQTDVYALWRRGAALRRRDLWSVLPLRYHLGTGEKHDQCIRKARKSGTTVSKESSEASYGTFHRILQQLLRERYDVAPVHSAEEMVALRDRFPDQMTLWLARDAGGECLAGTWVFEFSKTTWHTQYIASTAAGRANRATHLLLDCVIKDAAQIGVEILSIGACTEDDGRTLNAGLYAFKAGFGAGSAVHDTYRLELV